MWRGNIQTSIASTAKIAMMYAGYQLRADLQAIATGSQAANKEELFASLLATWDKSPMAHVGAVAKSPPRFERIFRFDRLDNHWEVEFVDSNKTPNQLKEIHYLKDGSREKAEKLNQAGFLDRLHLTIGWSDNSAASSCIRDLGFSFIAALLQQSGLYESVKLGGLWLGQDYSGLLWRRDPIGGFGQGGTGRALVAFFTLLAQSRLVDPPSSLRMLELMDKADGMWGSGSRSFFGEGLEEKGRTPAKLYSKLGILLPSTFHDAALIRQRTDKGADRSYVAVGLNGSMTTLRKLIVELEDCLR
jgi:hypothetical protein